MIDDYETFDMNIGKVVEDSEEAIQIVNIGVIFPENKSLIQHYFKTIVDVLGAPVQQIDSTIKSPNVALASKYELLDRLLGSSLVLVNPHNQTINWQSFYPLVNAKYSDKNQDENPLNGLRLGTLAHAENILFLEKLIKNANNYQVTHPLSHIKDPRKHQLDKMNINWRTPTPFREYRDKSIAYAVKSGFKF